MHYTSISVVAHAGAGTTGEEWNYKIPIIGSDKLYDLKPDPDASSTIVTVARGKDEGYMDITGLYDEICIFCEFNPFKIRDFSINDGGANTMIKQVIEDFMGEVTIRNDNWNFFYPSYNNGDSSNLVGPFYFGNGYSLNQAAYGTTPYGAGSYTSDVLYHWIQQSTFFTARDGITASFEIWPDKSIATGYIKTDEFKRSNDLIEACSLLINIWQREPIEGETEGRYNYTIQLKGYRYNQNRTTFIDERLNGVKTNHVYNPKNPLDNKQGDGDEGGDKDWNDDDPPVDVPPLPTLDITAIGGFNLFVMNGSAFKSLMDYFHDNSPGESIMKWFQNPIQGIAACYMVPYGVPRKSGSAIGISILGMPTGVSAPRAEQWTTHNMGSVRVPFSFGDTFLDYSPFCRAQIYLPFCGVKQLNIDEIVGKNVGVVYQFDNISGACVAYVTVNSSVKYSFTGSCAIGVPISQSNWGQTYISAATSAIGMLAGGVMGAAGAMSSATSLADVGLGAAEGVISSGGSLSSASGKPSITRSGSFSGAGSALGVDFPYLIIERPVQAKIDSPRDVIGYTSGRTISLGSLSGFAVIEQVHLKGITGTADEISEIEKLLHQGVIF